MQLILCVDSSILYEQYILKSKISFPPFNKLEYHIVAYIISWKNKMQWEDDN